MEAIHGMNNEELLSIVGALQKEFSLPMEKEEEKEWVEIPPSLTVKLTSLKPEINKLKLIQLIRIYGNVGFVEAYRLLENKDFPIVLVTIYGLLPHEIQPILKEFEDIGAIVDYDFDWGNYIE